MRTLGTRCPLCQNQLELSLPETAVEGYGQGLMAGFDQVLMAVGTAGININSYLNEGEKLKLVDSDISEFLSEPVEAVRRKMEDPERRLAERWKSKECGTEEYYRTTHDYLYDNAKYNRYPMYQVQRLLPMMLVRNMKTLDFGCGIGTLVFMLAGQKNDAAGYDLNPELIRFCEFRNSKYGMGARFTTEKPDFGQYNLITALGTLEHVENLEGLLAEMGSSMRPKALLYHYDDFKDQNISPMHFDYSGEIDGWIEKAGLKKLTSRWAVKP